MKKTMIFLGFALAVSLAGCTAEHGHKPQAAEWAAAEEEPLDEHEQMPPLIKKADPGVEYPSDVLRRDLRDVTPAGDIYHGEHILRRTAAQNGRSEQLFAAEDAEKLAKMVWGEARGCSPEEQLLVVWTVLQRVDAGGWGGDICEVVQARGQFAGYSPEHPVCPDIYELVCTALTDWRQGADPPTHAIFAPSLPYYFFQGDGSHNWFREEWR